MIPQRIITIWLSEESQLPSLIAKCLPTQEIVGYEHKIVGLEEAWSLAKDHKYLKECLEAKKWAKACDFLRVLMLYQYGGIYLDADVEILPDKNFDKFLDDKMFCGREKNNFVSNAIIGAEAGSLLLKDYLDTIKRNFIGSGDLVFAPGLYLFNEKVQWKPIEEVKIYPPPIFLPYCWQDDTMEQTDETICIHWFNRSWLPK